jgi:dihydropyrimidinase
MKTSIQNGTVVTEDHFERADILIEGERIGAIGPPGSLPPADLTVDAAGSFIFPGFIDLHTHLDDPIGGRYLADTWRSGSQIALLNGITTLYSFITQGPDESLAAAIERARSKAANRAFCDYGWHLTPTRFDTAGWREIEAAIDAGLATFKFYTTYREAGLYTDYAALEERIHHLNRLGCGVLVHCEDDGRLRQAREGERDWGQPLAHARVRPPEAEVTAIHRLIEIARRSGARIHIVHVSTPAGMAAVRAAASAQITCETCPHYLFLDESWLARPDGHRWICSPPLRTDALRRELAALTCAGGADCLATDHCAFTRGDKDDWKDDIRQVAGGIAGIGALPHLAFKLFKGEEAGLPAISRMLAAHPARFLGLYPRKGAIQTGADADLAVISLAGPEQPIRSSLADCHESYPGMTSRVQIKQVFLHGRLAAGEGRIFDPEKPAGRCLCGN